MNSIKDIFKDIVEIDKHIVSILKHSIIFEEEIVKRVRYLENELKNIEDSLRVIEMKPNALTTYITTADDWKANEEKTFSKIKKQLKKKTGKWCWGCKKYVKARKTKHLCERCYNKKRRKSNSVVQSKGKSDKRKIQGRKHGDNNRADVRRPQNPDKRKRN